MARQEQDREDLLGEATALVERAELRLADEPQPLFAGFRANGAASFYFGSEPVYQFNSRGQLRRAFVDGVPLKAEQGRLVVLRRVLSPDATNLERHVLDAEESAAWMDSMKTRLGQLLQILQAERYTVVGQVPENGSVVQRVITSLPFLLQTEVANSPRAL